MRRLRYGEVACFDLEKLLSNKDINDRHIEVSKARLAERKDGHEEEKDPL